ADGATLPTSAEGATMSAPADGESTHRAPAPWDEPAEVGPATWTADTYGRHRMPQSSVRPAATALVSGFVSFLTGRRPVLGGPRHAPVHSGNRHRQISA
ncbi:MAG TPA: hypothetical protein VE287_10545, partial [Actinopolymorphaceae bacterium]|nr:hypothetical protein [Actinopolymorphaceae bacterium]